ncbi:MAG: phosphoribosylformylglycinamidine synthase subunit PurQ [Deltaproteobacteria bacterium]|nr:phosphoribosylformylglycinamidine synthase subunit PurQ [Deltaproteobacteria bacterium]
MKKIKALILAGYGLNCEAETAYAFKLAGASADKIHINSVIKKKNLLKNYQILALPGGFSWGDEHGAGVLEALKLKTELGDILWQFIEDKKLIIGICNGFQTLINIGLLPGFFENNHNKACCFSLEEKKREYKPKKRSAALIANDCGAFIDKWVHLMVNKNSKCVFTNQISEIELPVRHSEGKFFATGNIIKKLIDNNQVVIRYADPFFKPADGNPLYNPNGSLRDIAGICDATGRIFGLMPHPESFNIFMNHPNWPLKKQMLSKKSDLFNRYEKIGIQIFENAVKYFL